MLHSVVVVVVVLPTELPAASFLPASPPYRHGDDLTFGRRPALDPKEAPVASDLKVDLEDPAVDLATAIQDTKDKDRLTAEGNNGKREEQVTAKAISNNQQQADRPGMVIRMLTRSTTRECTSSSSNQGTNLRLPPRNVTPHHKHCIVTVA